ncbi:LysR family glycine cleavage system transcriptional activator [Gemmobacter caeni]|uniref:LysR family glycine cleavage system transcriptional activator n=1 Tax=Gemmobacter caeni TaxID=589035 RepID=A0A2T6B398_9RHOB|nr:LysR substrate-binding domain-containing protein [Gemmobacter caeni]PTX50558.1 LysR family glycine cleavage system transcriptional activator [Gemmobacter caeni]TWI94704.1 LysR family glycine cleavage system transcriptional activator [Gemmobacter caeni]
MSTSLPPLRALQAFDAYGRTGTVHAAARSLGVTPGAISQQLRLLEDHAGLPLLLREGRRITMTPAAHIYHEMIAQGFDRLARAQEFISAQRVSEDLTVSGLPTLLQKWLNPMIHRFQANAPDTTLRIVATHRETEPQLMDLTFRLTYGMAASRYPHSRALFTDTCFPACSPEFLARHPEARTNKGLARLPLIGIDWGMDETAAPDWANWFAAQNTPVAGPMRTVAVYSLSSLALEAAAAGQGVVLAQASFAGPDLDSGRLVRLSDEVLPMPEAYFICWGLTTMTHKPARDFLNWVLSETKVNRDTRSKHS